MFDIGSSELLMIVVVAIVVIGPKDLPRALYKVGQIVGKARAMSRHFRSGIDAMIREVEMEEMERKWAEDNRRIMAQTPTATPLPDPSDAALPAAAASSEAAAGEPEGGATVLAGEAGAEGAVASTGSGAGDEASPPAPQEGPLAGKSA